MSNESVHPGTAPFSPLSTGSTCPCLRAAVAVETLSLPSPSITIAARCVDVPTPSCGSSSDRGMRTVGYSLSARTIGLALVAVFVALQAFLALYSGVAGIPGLFLINLAGGGATPLKAGTQDGG